MNNVAITASYSSPISSQSDLSLKETIFAAVTEVLGRHPILFAVTVNEDTSAPYFVRLEKISLDDAVNFRARTVSSTESKNETGRDVELEALLEDQHNTPFATNDSSPLWRVIVLLNPSSVIENEEGKERELTLAFIFHHSLGDGLSGMLFHRHFLAALSNPSTAPFPLNHTVFSTQAPLLPNLELLHPLPIPTPVKTPAPLALWGGEKITLPLRSRFRLLTFTPSTSAKLLQTCRAHNITLTAVLPVIVSRVLFEAIPQKYTDLECTVPATIRRWLNAKVDGESFGVFIDAFSLYFTRKQDFENIRTTIWDQALETKKSIKAYIDTNGSSINVAKFKYIRDMNQFFLSRIGQERASSFDVSNLGVFSNLKAPAKVAKGDENEQEDGWRVGSTIFSRCAFVSGSAISVSVVTGGDGCLVSFFLCCRAVEGIELTRIGSGFHLARRHCGGGFARDGIGGGERGDKKGCNGGVNLGDMMMLREWSVDACDTRSKVSRT